jgi:hypothetical protein
LLSVGVELVYSVIIICYDNDVIKVNWSFVFCFRYRSAKKWHSLRSCFARELRLQKQGKSGSGTKKRRKYIYFEKLLFLLPSMENRETRSNLDDHTSSGFEDEDCTRPRTEELLIGGLEDPAGEPQLPGKIALRNPSWKY